MEPITISLDKTNGDRAHNFFSIYTLEAIIGNPEAKIYLGNQTPQVCRFCKKTSPEVKFEMEAHVIPQFMGNRNLLSYFECDTCNKLFSKYEDSFANFFGISRTFAQIKGQTNKVPKFKDNKTGLEVYIGDDAVQMIVLEGKEVVNIDQDSNTFEVVTERPGYIPIHIPKIMIKLAMSMLSEEDLDDHDQMRKFIQQSEKDELFLNNNHLRIFGYFIPGPPKYEMPFVHLYKMKDGVDKKCFNRQIVLFYANYCFQMLVPFSNSDSSLQGENVDFPIYPLLIDNDYFKKFGKYQQLNLNLTSSVKKSGEEHKVTFSYENIKKEL